LNDVTLAYHKGVVLDYQEDEEIIENDYLGLYANDMGDLHVF
jgi:hypothetical protein